MSQIRWDNTGISFYTPCIKDCFSGKNRSTVMKIWMIFV